MVVRESPGCFRRQWRGPRCHRTTLPLQQLLLERRRPLVAWQLRAALQKAMQVGRAANALRRRRSAPPRLVAHPESQSRQAWARAAKTKRRLTRVHPYQKRRRRARHHHHYRLHHPVEPLLRRLPQPTYRPGVWKSRSSQYFIAYHHHRRARSSRSTTATAAVVVPQELPRRQCRQIQLSVYTTITSTLRFEARGRLSMKIPILSEQEGVRWCHRREPRTPQEGECDTMVSWTGPSRHGRATPRWQRTPAALEEPRAVAALGCRRASQRPFMPRESASKSIACRPSRVSRSASPPRQRRRLLLLQLRHRRPCPTHRRSQPTSTLWWGHRLLQCRTGSGHTNQMSLGSAGQVQRQRRQRHRERHRHCLTRRIQPWLSLLKR